MNTADSFMVRRSCLFDSPVVASDSSPSLCCCPCPSSTALVHSFGLWLAQRREMPSHSVPNVGHPLVCRRVADQSAQKLVFNPYAWNQCECDLTERGHRHSSLATPMLLRGAAPFGQVGAVLKRFISTLATFGSTGSIASPNYGVFNVYIL